jgi:hypothetical protein
VALLLIRGRHLLNPPDLPAPPIFTLGRIGGPIANIVGLAFAVLTTVFFLFPPALPVTPSNMNYTIVVFGIIAVRIVLPHVSMWSTNSAVYVRSSQQQRGWQLGGDTSEDLSTWPNYCGWPTMRADQTTSPSVDKKNPMSHDKLLWQ